jgi:shikimate dehydrogenase
MKLYGILGHPVGHSRSPAMHNRAFALRGLSATYVPFDVAPHALADAVRGLRALGVAGWNVTLPHKTAIMSLLDEVDVVARGVGAVNTVVREGERLIGTNTDAEGLSRALREAGVTLQGARVTVLGAGGAARAAVVGLGRAGASQLHVAARRASHATALARDLAFTLSGTQLSAGTLAGEALRLAFTRTDLLVQATSATLDDGPGAQAFADQLPLADLPKAAVVTDLVYRPLETSVLRLAAARGHTTVDGLGMLLHQGALAFERWTGQPAPLVEMRAALLGDSI